MVDVVREGKVGINTINEGDIISAIVHRDATNELKKYDRVDSINIKCDFSSFDFFKDISLEESPLKFKEDVSRLISSRMYTSHLPLYRNVLRGSDFHSASFVAHYGTGIAKKASSLLAYDSSNPSAYDDFCKLFNERRDIYLLSDFVGAASALPLAIMGQKILQHSLPSDYTSLLLNSYVETSSKYREFHSSIIIGKPHANEKSYALELACAPFRGIPAIYELDKPVMSAPVNFIGGTDIFGKHILKKGTITYSFPFEE